MKVADLPRSPQVKNRPIKMVAGRNAGRQSGRLAPGPFLSPGPEGRPAVRRGRPVDDKAALANDPHRTGPQQMLLNGYVSAQMRI